MLGGSSVRRLLLSKKASSLALLAVVATTALGCSVGNIVWRNAGTFFSSPNPVAQNRHPVGPDARLAVVWVGHATALIQIEDKVILTDPIFTSTVGQVTRRRTDPGIAPKDLPPVDAVLISHMHQDHLSLGSLEMIEDKVRAILLPRGGTAYLSDGFKFPAWEVRTWQIWEKNGLRITAVPVDHQGFRYGVDDAWMTEAFTGWMIEYKGIKVYYGGDTAYDQRVFVETGQRYPNIDLALLPIGPIEPAEIMRRTHLDPAQALQAFFDLGANRMVPVHYDTFFNTDEPGESVRQLNQEAKKWNLGRRIIAPIAVGERRVFVKAGESATLTEPANIAPSASTTPTSMPKKPAVPDDDNFE
jgi:N-acyl-phosphatidylethanolamine-hydrolysing phospholipase D